MVQACVGPGNDWEKQGQLAASPLLALRDLDRVLLALEKW